MNKSRHKLVPITPSPLSFGPKVMTLSRLNNLYHHWCDYEVEEGRVIESEDQK